MLSVAGADHIITMDLHASQIQVIYGFQNRIKMKKSPSPSVRDFCKKSDTYKYNKPFFCTKEFK